ncbi:MAG: winged helix-turn-helix domain-containing protein [Nitrososphaerales archaeon]
MSTNNGPLAIPLENARKLNLIKQHLVTKRPKKPTSRDILELMRTIRYLQIDPTNIVCKSHLLVLWSRLGNYDVQVLDKMLWKERSLFEYWAHGASIVLTRDYPLFKLGMKTIVSDIDRYRKRIEDWYIENKKLADYIERELASRGPLTSAQFEDRSVNGWRSTGWSNERNVGKMLEVLQKKGRIIVESRTIGGHKKWDLTRNCLKILPKEEFSDREIIRRGLEISLKAMGVATLLQMRDYFQPGRMIGGEIDRAIEEMVKEGVILPITIVGASSKKRTGTWFIHSEDTKMLDNLERYWKPKTTLLSPFDNLIYDRVRTNYLFSFNFTFEAYVPKEKRIFGYFVLPILHGDKLVGRIDPEMDRKSNVLKINAIYFEKGVDQSNNLIDDISKSIGELAKFLRADKVIFSNDLPKKRRRF